MQHNQGKSVQGFVIQPLRVQIHFLFGVFKKSLQPVKPKPELTDPQSAKAIMKQSSIKKTNKKAESKKESERDRERKSQTKKG